MREFKGYKRGINLGGWLSQCVSYEKEHFDTFITEEDIKTIAGWGLDHVRLPIDYDIIMTEDNVFMEEGFAYIDKCIDWCRKYNLNMVLDLHKTKGYMFDDNAVPNPDLFFTEQKLQDDFIFIWEELTKRYAKYSDFLSFELLNEVVNPAYGKKWNEIVSRAIGVIRAVTDDSYIIIGGTNNNSAIRVAEIDVPIDDKIVFTFHCYEPLIFTHQKAYWVKGMPDDFEMHFPETIQEMRDKCNVINKDLLGVISEPLMENADGRFFETLFDQAIQYAQLKNVPLYCGEYGVIDRVNEEDTLAWFHMLHDALEKYNIGRALWNYRAKDFGLTDAHYAEMKDEIIPLL